MQSKTLLQSFTAHCEANPTERFWQALRNWSKAGFILKVSGKDAWDKIEVSMYDTFYID